jgi:hypothetical protein
VPYSREKRMHVWRHNGLGGSVRMALVQMRKLQQSASTSPEAKRLASKIDGLLVVLQGEMRHRVDPPELNEENT